MFNPALPEHCGLRLAHEEEGKKREEEAHYNTLQYRGIVRRG